MGQQRYDFYVDESGSREPDRRPNDGNVRRDLDYFAMGGVLVNASDREAVEAAHREFCDKWNISHPLHSTKIRSKSGPFRWIKKLGARRAQEFNEDLLRLITLPQLTTLACVIDKPGYNARYADQHPRRWLMCKTAFSVILERACKYVLKRHARLDVFFERCSKADDDRLEGYCVTARHRGSPFDASASAKYFPLTAEDYQRALHSYDSRSKTSPLMQLADLVLYPVRVGGYYPSDPTYVAFKNAGALVDCRLTSDAIASEGIKYSCWELLQKQESPASENVELLAAAGNAPEGRATS